MDERTFQELIDACRARGDDLQSPDMAPLAERMADDARLAESFRYLARCLREGWPTRPQGEGTTRNGLL